VFISEICLRQVSVIMILVLIYYLALVFVLAFFQMVYFCFLVFIIFCFSFDYR